MIRSIPTLCFIAAASLLAGAGVAQAQQSPPASPAPAMPAPQPSPKPDKPDSPDSAKPRPSESPKPDARPGASSPITGAQLAYPPTPQKNLWADNDFRNKKAPKLEIEEWLSSKPDWKNKTLLVDFWATWCPPCRKLIPELEGWQEKYKDDLVVVGLTAEPAKTIADFIDLRGAKVQYPMARDGQNRTNKEIGVKGIPHVLVISSDGIVRWQGYPLSEEDPLTEAKLKQIIDADKAALAKNAKLDARSEEKKADAPKPGDNKPGENRSDEPKPAGK